MAKGKFESKELPVTTMSYPYYSPPPPSPPLPCAPPPPSPPPPCNPRNLTSSASTTSPPRPSSPSFTPETLQCATTSSSITITSPAKSLSP
ncbi:hypothetical protein M0R45_027391 [Rubus argutus]|uniref:Uncharacterized protein n=1 Tax=Rubus argutus TaxID=59490 RepID=A0AAW1X097_RUBAR